MTEHDIQNQILQYIPLRGGIAIRVNSGSVLVKRDEKTYRYLGAEPGTSDIIGLYRTRFLAIEVKNGKNLPTEVQVRFLETVRECGGIGIVAYSLDDVISVLDEIDKKMETKP